MKKFLERGCILIVALAAMVVLAGCTALNNLSAGVADKAVSGSGYVMTGKLGVDPVDKIPAAYMLLIKGDYTSIPTGMEFIQYSVESDASVFNSGAVFTRTRFIFSSSDRKRMDTVIGSIAADIDARAKIEAEKAKAAATK